MFLAVSLPLSIVNRPDETGQLSGPKRDSVRHIDLSTAMTGSRPLAHPFEHRYNMSVFARKFYFALAFHLAACCDTERIPALDRQLYSSVAKERNQAALDLARCGSKASKSVSRLGELLYDANVGVQSSAAYALRQIDTKEARAHLERAEEARRKR